MRHLRYLRNLLRHKWFVFLECCKLGIPWLGITHDISKFFRCEWSPYVEYFYGDGKSDPDGMDEFDIAWLHHQKRNKHHWQYWMLTADDFLKGNVNIIKPIRIPRKYEKEMLADWRGASRAYTGSSDALDWYLERRERFSWVMHPESISWIEAQLGIEQ